MEDTPRIKKRLPSPFTMLKLTATLVFCASISSAADVQLSPAGPISTPQAALDAARAAVKPVRIIVGDGVYPLTGPVALTADDSAVTWEAAPGARPVFTGGRAVTGWTKAEGGLWKAALPDKAWKFEQLWINGRRATLARSPNKGCFHITKGRFVEAGVWLNPY